MKTKRIVFTGIGKAELWDYNVPHPKEGEVLVETMYTAVSAGTERANLMRMPNTGAYLVDDSEPVWSGGYSSTGIVKEIGEGVKSVSVGDKVLVIWGPNTGLKVVPEHNVIKIEDRTLDLKHAAFALIASFSAAGVRKTRLEFGESAMVFGIGILGAFAVQICRLAGAFPVIAADLNPERRTLALDLGADYAFNPADDDFVHLVKDVTKGAGVKAIIEVTGQSLALKQALDCIAPMGRISLLGCTRISDTPIDFYRQVHRPGIMIVGAHTHARPKLESYPHYWTERDDCIAILNFMAHGRMDMSKIISEVHYPEEAPEVYQRLAENKDFPVGVLFDWTKINQTKIDNE
ncbi:MAG TPA: zinc-binding alcohol dehydrogenase [Clostridiaceae bacterium]|nr:zinc-binding alcohol dehydrogenase [Clostridiaceae bacterium]